MKIDVSTLDALKEASDVVPGNVYPAKGGKGSTHFWLVVSITSTGAHLIGFDVNGLPVSTASYLKSAMRERPILGRIDISSIVLKRV